MNLFDLVNRKDQGVEFAGDIRTGIIERKRAVTMTMGARMRIRNAHEFYVCKTLSDFGWSIGGGSLAIYLDTLDGRRELASAKVKTETPLVLQWPADLPDTQAYDLSIEAAGKTTIFMGPWLDTRAALAPLAAGKGVEIGPGLRPTVKPGPDVDVSYVEAKHPDDWETTYRTGQQKPPPEIMSRYVIGSGATLEMFEPGSLDFIFSAHVIEHMVNPLQVLRNWLETLKPGGRLLAVIPDLRFTFDCRQSPSTLVEVLEEEVRGVHEIALDKYERWCRYTEPRHKPADLIRRNYSIHVNYFTPEVAASIADVLVSRKLASRWWIRAAQNNRDFALAIWKIS